MTIIVVFAHGFQTTQDAWYHVFNGSLCVNVFFVISGYLLFWKEQHAFAGYGRIVARRFWSLAVPYLLWNAIGLLFFALPREFWTKWMLYFGPGEDAATLTATNLLNSLLLHPVAYPLWFVRSLFLLVLAFPVWHLILKRFGLLPVVALIVFRAFLPIHGQHVDSVCYFLLGGWLGMTRADLHATPAMSGGWLLLWFGMEFVEQVLGEPVPGTPLVAGFAIWVNAGWMSDYLDPYLSRFYKHSFFLYAFHQPLSDVFSKWLNSFLPEFSLRAPFLYLIGPVCVIPVGIAMASMLEKVAPRALGILTGGRSVRFQKKIRVARLEEGALAIVESGQQSHES